jgi:glycosyltransferase involved in cell wall biosynthesis
MTHLHIEKQNNILRIGFISVWFERGQAYVTKTLRDCLAQKHSTFLFARTGRVYGERKLETGGFWAVPRLTSFPEYEIPADVIGNWVNENQLDAVIFNEEYDWDLVRACKAAGVKVLTYLDFFQEEWKPLLKTYDAVLCSTRRTYNLVKNLCPAHYIGWAIDTDLFKPVVNENRKYTFFHNAGWLGINYRKMTPAAIVAFEAVSRHLLDVTFFIHAQTALEQLPAEVARLARNNPRLSYQVETLPAPGLYHLGQIQIFPSKLEGLGLPLLEGMACGLPAIATDAPPMNEFVRHAENGLLVSVSRTQDRPDQIAFPEALVEINDLAVKMAELAQDPVRIERLGQNARKFILENMNPQAFAGRLQTVIESLF